MKILVTGGAGYVGSVLVERLLEKKHSVTVLDKLVFGGDSLKPFMQNENFRLLQGDICRENDFSNALAGNECVIHLAALVGDPACCKDPELTIRTNFDATLKIGEICRQKKIKKFIFTSTCSVYGYSETKKLTEESSLNPVSLYAITRLYSERTLRVLSNENFQPTILRLGTVYGLSPRMRFDLVVNTLSMKAARDGKINIFGGNQWRPFVHVTDVTNAVMSVLGADNKKTAGNTFNVGSNRENYMIKDIGKIISGIYPEVKVDSVDEIDDPRSYNVNFDKIEKTLGFKPKKTLGEGIKEMYDAVKSGRIPDTADKKYYNHLC